MKLFLFELNHTNAVPGVVVTRVEVDGLAETGERLVHLFDETILVAEQIVGVDEFRIELGGTLKELDGRVMLFVQAKAIAESAPRLGR